MSQYTHNSLVAVYPFSRQLEGDEVIIGRPDSAAFLVLPLEAVEILDSLAQGKTVGEAQGIYQDRHNEVPDIEDFLTTLEQEGFVQPMTVVESDQSDRVTKKTSLSHLFPVVTPRFHFAHFPRPLAQRLFGRTACMVYGMLMVCALAAIILDPSLIPGWDALLFHENMSFMRLVVTVLGFVAVFLHEMAHLVAARAVGVSSRLNISNRMWVLVAETDMTGIWSIPSNQRYLPFLAGPLLDVVSISVLILISFSANQGWIILPSAMLQLSRALLFTYLLGLLWQCYFFVRTDFYYVIANFFRCKNLMGDTTIFLRNQIGRIIRPIGTVDQSHIPPAERRVIRYYAIFWVLGRIVAFIVLVFAVIPLIYSYYIVISAILWRGYTANPYAFIDALVMGSIFFIIQGAGFWLWIRGLYATRR